MAINMSMKAIRLKLIHKTEAFPPQKMQHNVSSAIVVKNPQSKSIDNYRSLISFQLQNP